MRCKICGGELGIFDTAKIIGKYDIKYYECLECGFIQTEEPYWLSESYGSAITNSDIGLIQRNIDIARKLDILFQQTSGICPVMGGHFLDYGGGYGMLVRMMRDRGYDFEWYDEYCENLFAQTHEKSINHYDVVTSVEMLEHLPNPMETLKIIFELGDTIIFTTSLIPSNRPKIDEWWYYATDHGQHVAFYTKQSMEYIARHFERKYFNGAGFHIFSNRIKSVSTLKMRIRSLPIYIDRYLGNHRHSLLKTDFELLTGKKLG